MKKNSASDNNNNDNKTLISVMSSRVAIVQETQEEIKDRLQRFENWLSEINLKIDKITDKIFEKPEYFSVGEIALKQGVSTRTVRRHIAKGNIPFERTKGEKSYRIPSDKYYQSLSYDGYSRWFQNHT